MPFNAAIADTGFAAIPCHPTADPYHSFTYTCDSITACNPTDSCHSFAYTGNTAISCHSTTHSGNTTIPCGPEPSASDTAAIAADGQMPS